MVCIFYYFYAKTFLFQLQAKIKKLFEAEIESNIIQCAAAWNKKKDKISAFSHLPLLMNYKQN